MKSDVLIVGAGPTGLVLALHLAKYGVSLRIIEKNAGPGEASRALIVHARTLEFYDQMGFAEEVIHQGIEVKTIQFREGKKVKANIYFRDLGKGLSPFPFALSYPQDDHEQLLINKLADEGVEVEWETELVSFMDEGDHVQAVIKKDNKEERSEFSYICGCDGAHSTVRRELAFDFPGGTYEELFFVADVKANTGQIAESSLNVYLDSDTFYLFMPVRSTGMERIIGIVPRNLTDQSSVAFKDFQSLIEQRTGLTIQHVNWFQTYKVHHRVSSHFRKGRAFIAGDAGHIHSPAGGQGMNTGIGDAVNLAWKLAAVLLRKTDEGILDTFEEERINFARTLIDTTDRAFTSIIGDHMTSKLLRKIVIPNVAPFTLRSFSIARKAAFRRLSQINIHYRNSQLSVGTAGKVHGGDRLPWIRTESCINYDALKSMDWQLHVYGQANEAVKGFARVSGYALYEFSFEKAMTKKGLQENALYLIRPDGYVALADSEQNVERLKQYVSKFNILSLDKET
ncbi:FAD-dependent oxidoreductase [Pseudalkalibacillus sp. JSM 102089]|uniref:FAD-dependent oxidoreductase n=1 Tax=Pseudalkalibacillus sp. JSM 102089 TaxID=3229856 RepID=UPI0035255191